MKVRSPEERILRLDEVNLIIASRDVSSVLATIVFKGLIGQKPVDFLWMTDGVYDDNNLAALLGRKERIVACIGFGPKDGLDMQALIHAINSDKHRIAAVCDIHGRSFWLRQIGSFSQLFLQPQNSDYYFSCPGRVLLNAYAEQLEGYEHELCELSHNAAKGELRGFARTIASIAPADPSMDWRRNNVVNHFAFNREPSPQILGWIQEARAKEEA